MATAVLLIAAVTAAVTMVLVWREARRKLDEQEFYVAPMTYFRRELSLAGICTIASVIIWVSYMPASVRLASGALFPVYLYIFMVTRKRTG